MTKSDSPAQAPASTHSLLAIEANFDPITKAAFKYRRKHVYPYLEGKGVTVTILSGRAAVRRRVAAEALRQNVTYLTGVGHGEEQFFCGYKNQQVFHLGQYAAEEVRDKIIHLLSCSNANDLGEDFRAQGCRAFFGYKGQFAIPFNDVAELNDVAEEFFGSDAEIDRALADGIPIEEVQDRVRRKFDEHIARLDQRGQRESSAALESNRNLLIGLF